MRGRYSFGSMARPMSQKDVKPPQVVVPAPAFVVTETRQQRRARQRLLAKASRQVGMELVDSRDLDAASEDEQ